MRTPILAAGVLLCGSAAADESVEFTLRNQTTQAIIELYAAPANHGDWEDEILGGETLNPGDAAKLTIDDGRRKCIYDLKARFKDGADLEKHDLNFCELESFTFTQ